MIIIVLSLLLFIIMNCCPFFRIFRAVETKMVSHELIETRTRKTSFFFGRGGDIETSRHRTDLRKISLFIIKTFFIPLLLLRILVKNFIEEEKFDKQRCVVDLFSALCSAVGWKWSRVVLNGTGGFQLVHHTSKQRDWNGYFPIAAHEVATK